MSESNIEANPTTIHPALDFTSEHAYVGQWLRRSRDSTFRVIRDDGEIIQFTGNSLECSGLELTHYCTCIEPRWSTESILRFSRGETETTTNAQLFQATKEKLRLYIELSDERLYDFLALWNIGTYFFPLFNSYPYVYLSGIKNSGKTRLLTLCSCISFNSILSANMTTATVYRLIQASRCSLFIDETEQLSTKYRAEDFRNVLLSGYRKGLRVYRNRRNAEGNFEVEALEVYGPKMLASIEGLEEVLESRCITITMQRSSNRDLTNRELDINDLSWQSLRDKIYVFMMRNWRAIKQTYAELENSTSLTCRDWELWKPILSLAKFFGNAALFEEIRDLAIDKAEEAQRNDSETDEYVLVNALLPIITKDGYYSLRTIKDAMAGYFENASWLTERTVGRMLRRLGFGNRRRVKTGYQYLFKVSQVRDLAQRLGIITNSETGEGSEHSELGEHPEEQGIQTLHDAVVTVEKVEECQEEK
jgi:hypothetical protein